MQDFNGMSTKNNISSRAISKYVRMSPTKVRRVLNQARGRIYEEALILLEFLSYMPWGKPVLGIKTLAKRKYSNILVIFHKNKSRI